MDFQFNPGNGLFVPVVGTPTYDMHGNAMVHIAPQDSPDGRERWIHESNPCIREPEQVPFRREYLDGHVEHMAPPSLLDIPTIDKSAKWLPQLARQHFADMLAGDRKFRNIW